jgi:hypothetical protein
MFELSLFLALQAAVPQQVAMTSVEQPAEETQVQSTQQPERKRVCRTQLDTRVGLIAKQRRICRFEDAGEADGN